MMSVTRILPLRACRALLPAAWLLVAAMVWISPVARGEVRGAAAAVPGAEPVRYRTDEVLLRLTPSAAATVRGGIAPGDRMERTMPPGEPARAKRLARLGLPGVDRIGSQLAATFEQEFPNEAPPATGAVDFSRYWIAHLPHAVTPERAIASFRAVAEVDVARAIAVAPVTVVPNDSLWSSAYYFLQTSRRDLHAPEAWDVCRGDSSISVAILDTGVLTSHPDLSGHIWTNRAEAGGLPGVDDDGNGFVDDLPGWDFVDLPSDTLAQPGEDWRDEDNDPNDYAGHGTAVAGLVGALTNNRIGVAGALWDVRIMPLRVGWSASFAASGAVDLSYAARAVRYATRAGATVVNCSFLSEFEEDLDDAVTAAIRAGVTVVVAAGNNGSEHSLGDRNDVISVAATDRNDVVTAFSNRGDYVDVAAPGLLTTTTSLRKDFSADSAHLRQPDYTPGASGTSFSSPLAAGEAALIQARRHQLGLPPLSPANVLLRLVDTADDISDVNQGIAGYGAGRINYQRALSDPPTSYAATVRAMTVGPAAVLSTLTGSARFAVAASDGRLLMLEGIEGNLVWSAALPAPPVGGVAAADLGEGHGLGLFVAVEGGRIAGLDATGHALPGWPVSAAGGVPATEPVEPALGDLYGEGRTEIVWGGSDGAVWAWSADGVPLAGFPHAIGQAGRNVLVALADLDGRPGLEIVAALANGTVSALRADGTSLPGWPIVTPSPPMPPIVTTLGGDPRPCVVVAAGSSVRAVNPDGSIRWRQDLPGLVAGSPAVGDIDRDGYEEIAVAFVPDQLAVLDSAGARRASITLPRVLTAGTLLPMPVMGSFQWGLAGVLLQTGEALRGWDVTGAPLPGFPRSGVAGASPSLGDIDGDGRTEIVAGSGADSLVYVYDAGPYSWDPGLKSWPTAGGSPARTGSRLGAQATVVVDDLPPSPVADLAASVAGPGEVGLSWSAPRDSGGTGRAARYDVRRSTLPIGQANFETAETLPGAPVPGSAGTAQAMRVSGLHEERTYYFALRSLDGSGNASAASNLAFATLPPAPPADVSDLAVVGATDTSLILAWTASGDDGRIGRPARYLVHADDKAFLPQAFDAAPITLEVAATRDAGGRESAALTGLGGGKRYWIALEAEDSSGHRSGVSDIVDARVGPLALRTGLAIISATQPARPPVDLHWQLGGPPSGRGRIEILDLAGRIRKSFPLGGAGEGMERWDGRDGDGRDLPAGIYFARIQDGRHAASARIVLLR